MLGDRLQVDIMIIQNHESKQQLGRYENVIYVNDFNISEASDKFNLLVLPATINSLAQASVCERAACFYNSGVNCSQDLPVLINAGCKVLGQNLVADIITQY